MSNQFIKNLQTKRQSFVESMRENNFENGIKNLLTQLYPENAHFIYELLQNAEDTGANNVTFELKKDKLIFSHDGRVFDEEDLKGITSIGEGTKKDDVNQIGKFGVGFKAVFAYTNSPIIHSNLYNFKIVDLVIPYEIEGESKSDMTIMQFPFNSEKSKETAYKEIHFGLKNLHDNTLLFLNNIRKVELIIDEKTKIIERKENGNSIEIIADNKTSHWIRFKKYIVGSDTLFTSIAFSFDVEKNEIKPLTKGEVSVYFPAEKETSNLKFHIHAPFASTVARDSVINSDENNELIDQISDLLCESILELKNDNLFNLDFINCLPIDDDNVNKLYKPIHDKIIQFFLGNELIPTYDGTFVYPKYTIKANKKIRDIFSTEFLLLLEEFENFEVLYYCKNSTQNNNRIDKFLQKLNIYELEDENLVDEIINLNNKLYDSESFDKIYKFLKSRDSSWFLKLYIFLHEFFQKDDWRNYLNGILINRAELMYLVKIDSESYPFNYDEKPCFFKTNDVPINSDLLYVDELTYEINSKQKSDKPTLFLKSLGLKELNIKEELLVILDEFYTGKHRWVFTIKKNINLHLKHWRKILSFYETDKKECIEMLNKYQTFVNKSLELTNNKNILKAPPFFNEDENYLIGYINCDFLSTDIYLNFNENELDLFKEILSKIDFKSRLVIKKVRITQNTKHPNYSHIIRSYRRYETNNSEYEIDCDYFIENFNFFILNPSLEKSSLLCSEINVIDSKFLTAKYQRNSRENGDSDSSFLVYQLKNNSWLPTKENEFKKPCEIFLENLHPDFEKYIESKFFKLIEFGRDEELSKVENPIDDEVFVKTGGDYNSLDEILEKKEELEAKCKELEAKQKEIENENNKLKSQLFKPRTEKTNEPKSLIESIKLYNKVNSDENQKIQLSSEIVKIEKKYVNAVNLKLQEAISKSKNERIKKNRNVFFKTGVKETREFLYRQYQGICQICQFTFVNVVRKRYHYNILDLFDNKQTKAGIYFINPGTSICLCSNCHSAVKYGEFNADFIETIESNIKIKNLQSFSKYFQEDDFLCENKPNAYSSFDNDYYKLPITLLGKKMHIHYNEEHILHFITVLDMNIQDLG